MAERESDGRGIFRKRFATFKQLSQELGEKGAWEKMFEGYPELHKKRMGHYIDNDTLANDGDALSQSLDLADDVRRKKDRGPIGLSFTQQAINLLLHEGIETAGGLVQQQQIGTVHQCLQDPHLDLVPFRQVSDRDLQIEIEPRGEPTHVCPVRAVPAQRIQIAQLLLRCQVVVQDQLPG